MNERIFIVEDDATIRTLLENFAVDISRYDVIRGYRADDSYFSFAQDFISGMISYPQLTVAMRLGNLGEQIVLKSEEAFARIRFRSAKAATREVWLSARPDTNLRRLRVAAGFSQDDLARLSGVPVRMIQHYEQRVKRINRPFM